MPMKGLRRNDDAMKKYRWYQKKKSTPAFQPK
jgi:hypothetical protein